MGVGQGGNKSFCGALLPQWGSAWSMGLVLGGRGSLEYLNGAVKLGDHSLLKFGSFLQAMSVVFTSFPKAVRWNWTKSLEGFENCCMALVWLEGVSPESSFLPVYCPVH